MAQTARNTETGLNKTKLVIHAGSYVGPGPRQGSGGTMRLSRLADFAVVLMTHVAQHQEQIHAAAEIALATQLPAPTVAKILTRLCREGLLSSIRGVKGGGVPVTRWIAPDQCSRAEGARRRVSSRHLRAGARTAHCEPACSFSRFSRRQSSGLSIEGPP